MKLHINWKKTIIVCLDILLAAYLVMAMTSFNKPDETAKMCTKVNIYIADENTNGFLSAKEIKNILSKKKLYPLKQQMEFVNPRTIEDVLKTSSFVNTAQCYKTQDGHVCINIAQRLPIVRIKSNLGDDYYVDDEGGIMPNSKYTSDLVIATGNINRVFAKSYICNLTEAIMENEFWKHQIEQINVLPDMGIELIPRVGDHIIFIGYLPKESTDNKRKAAINSYVKKKLNRMEKFYQYGLNEVGWNKYHYISLEFENQIICKKHDEDIAQPVPSNVVMKPENENTTSIVNSMATQQNNTDNLKKETTVDKPSIKQENNKESNIIKQDKDKNISNSKKQKDNKII